MPKTYTLDGNYAQNIEHRRICAAAREEKAINRAATSKRPKRSKGANPNSLPTGSWDAETLPRAAPPRTGKSYPFASAKRGGRA